MKYPPTEPKEAGAELAEPHVEHHIPTFSCNAQCESLMQILLAVAV